ncbi:MAG: ricin-type beta-trefoil lectin domain protein [Saccharothrix sp.]|nr:ricin-type beta-trefoil lectin domain protein [Saccharothrix sp.]
MSGSTYLRSTLAAMGAVVFLGSAAASAEPGGGDRTWLENRGKAGYCLEPAGASVRMAPCTRQVNQLWEWGPDDGLLRSVGAGWCLTAHAGKPVVLESCAAGNPDQTWAYYYKYEVFEIYQQPRALTAHADSADVTTEPWHEGNAYQQWPDW